MRAKGLEPLAEVEGALLVVEVLHAPHPELGSLLLGLGEHPASRKEDHCQSRTHGALGSARGTISKVAF